MSDMNAAILAAYTIIALGLLIYMILHPGKVARVADKASRVRKESKKENLQWAKR